MNDPAKIAVTGDCEIMILGEHWKKKNIQFRKPNQNRKSPLTAYYKLPRWMQILSEPISVSILPARVAPSQVKFISPAATQHLKGGTNQGRSLSDFPVCSCPFSLVTTGHHICKNYLNSEPVLGREEPNRRRWKTCSTPVAKVRETGKERRAPELLPWLQGKRLSYVKS